MPDTPGLDRADRAGPVQVGRRAGGAVEAGDDPVLRDVPTRAARAAAAELAEHYDVGAELWSATSYKTLREEAMAAERCNRLHPSQEREVPLVAQLLAESQGPIIAVSDFMTLVPEQVIRFLPGRTFVPLGTDGMGRSDTREALRRHFEIDTGHVVVGVLTGLLADGVVDAAVVADAIARYDIDPDAADPFLS